MKDIRCDNCGKPYPKFSLTKVRLKNGATLQFCSEQCIVAYTKSGIGKAPSSMKLEQTIITAEQLNEYIPELLQWAESKKLGIIDLVCVLEGAVDHIKGVCGIQDASALMKIEREAGN